MSPSEDASSAESDIENKESDDGDGSYENAIPDPPACLSQVDNDQAGQRYSTWTACIKSC